jgi:hypothetical protein
LLRAAQHIVAVTQLLSTFVRAMIAESAKSPSLQIHISAAVRFIANFTYRTGIF